MPEWLKKFVELNPVLIRGLLVTFFALVTKVVGVTVVDNDTIDLIIDLFVSITALITALWARNKVIAENKIVAWRLDPHEPNNVVPGPALILNEVENEQLVSAATISRYQGEARREYNRAA